MTDQPLESNEQELAALIAKAIKKDWFTLGATPSQSRIGEVAARVATEWAEKQNISAYFKFLNDREIRETIATFNFWLQIAEEHKAEIISEWFDFHLYPVAECQNAKHKGERWDKPGNLMAVFTLKQDTELVNPQHDRSED